MRTRNRKRALLVSVRGGLMVLLAVVLQAVGFLTPLESILYNARVRQCQGDQPPPAPSLVHMDVDDNALSVIGRWPWAPPTTARIIDEVALAGPKVMAMDVLYADQRTLPDGGVDPAWTAENRELAAAFARLGCAVLPASLTFDADRPPSKLRRLLLPLLVEDPERTREQCAELLRPAGLTDADVDAEPTDSFIRIRESAFFERIWRELDQAQAKPPDAVALRRRLLPHDDPLLTGSPAGRLFDAAYDRVSRERALQRFSLPMAAAGNTPVALATSEVPPLLPLCEAAANSGFVDDLRESVEGTVRSVPLLARYRGRLVPQMGLVAACAVLGTDLRDVRLTDTTLTIPRTGGAADVTIPVSVRDSPIVGSVGAVMELPLFGRKRDWQTMYDVPHHERPAHHVSVVQVWQACEVVLRLQRNNASIDQSLKYWMDRSGGAAAVAQFEAAPPKGEARHALIRATISDTAEYVKNLGDVPDLDAGTKEELVRVRRINASLNLLVAQDDDLEGQLSKQRAGLRAALHGKAIFFGGTATSLSDIRPTALFGATPGVLVHGAVFNAILTGKMWRQTPASWGLALTAAAGLATLMLTMWGSPGLAFLGSFAVGVGYLAFNGYYLFARHNLIVEAAGPAVAIALVYVGMTLGNYLTEVADKARITRRLGKYVDPRVRDFLLAHPEHERFDGQQRELTIGFSDLAGFTTLTDQLGERVVPILADYVGHMIPVIQRHEGTFDKQIGDGLCFFFGAPIPDEVHARRAVRTALAMHAGLAAFNGTLEARGFAPLGMRIGLATGAVIVGDAGAEGAASYTTLGGTTNLASRLEGANKNFGTRTLITARTVELLGDEFLCRPIANLRVAGKLNCTVVYEPLCAAAEATDEDRRLAACTAAVFDAYRVGDFAGCVRAVAEMETAVGPSKFTHLYAERSANPPDSADHCDGQIVLSEK